MHHWGSKLTTTFQPLLAGILDLVAPARCIGCLEEDTWLCLACQHILPLSHPTCIVCQRPQARGLTCPRCRLKSTLTGVISAGSYGSPLLQRGVQWLKFKGVTAVAPTLATLLAPHLLTISSLDHLRASALLVPIPLHVSRFRQRGFNQSAEIAAALASMTGIPTATLLRRTKATWRQTKLSEELRQMNMQEAFALEEAIPAERSIIILLDDVTTTGATLTAAAAALTPVQGSQVWGCTVARG